MIPLLLEVVKTMTMTIPDLGLGEVEAMIMTVPGALPQEGDGVAMMTEIIQLSLAPVF